MTLFDLYDIGMNVISFIRRSVGVYIGFRLVIDVGVEVKIDDGGEDVFEVGG